MSFRRFLLLIAALGLARPLDAGLGLGLGKAAAKRGARLTEKTAAGSASPSCGTGSTFFTVAPLAATDFTGLVPLGNLSPSGHTFPTDHLYLYTPRSDPNNFASPALTVPVVSPGSAYITAIAAFTYLNASPAFTDYRVTFSPCREFQANFAHISLDPALVGQAGPFNNCYVYGTGGALVQYCENSGLNIPIQPGQRLGSAGSKSAALDFGAYDSRVTAPFANPARYPGNTAHTVCPLDYFAAPVKNALKARLGKYDGKVLRTAEPVCGTNAQDLPGTAQGNWFKPGAPDNPEDPHLALVHDNVIPSTPVFSVGASVPGLGPGAFSFAPLSAGLVRRDFSAVTPDGHIYCYDSFPYPVNTIILLQMTEASTLRIEKQDAASCGAGPWAFGAGAVAFQR